MRDFAAFDDFLTKMSVDIYPEPPSEPEMSIAIKINVTVPCGPYTYWSFLLRGTAS